MILGNRYSVITEGDNTNTSSTYICNDLITGEPVFIKKLKASSVGDSTASELFKREIRALSILEHPNIIKYLDSGSYDNAPFIVTQHFQSKNLYQAILENDFDIDLKCEICLKIAEGIIYAHENGVIHRDIKPQNILINDNNEVKIVDFGISKIKGMLYNPSETLKEYMSVRYSAPEQLQRLEVKVESDLYALGLLVAFIFIEVEPPETKTDLVDYFENITISQIKELVTELTQSDLNQRPRSAYKVKNVLRMVKLENIALTMKIYVSFSTKSLTSLHDIGLVHSANNQAEIRAFVSEDIKNYLGYKIQNKYIFIGERI